MDGIQNKINSLERKADNSNSDSGMMSMALRSVQYQAKVHRQLSSSESGTDSENSGSSALTPKPTL
jgi:hypothetical protein